MAVGFPAKTNFATGDVLTATNMNDVTGTLNLAQSGQYASGKNLLLNGDLSIWQRGTSFTVSGATGYSADRLVYFMTPAGTISRQLTNDTTNLPGIQYCARVQRTSGNTNTGGINVNQSLETANCLALAGKTVTFSYYARKGSTFSSASNALSIQIITGTGTDQNVSTGFTGQTTLANGVATLTSTWQRFTVSATIGATITQVAVVASYNPVGTAGGTDYFEITGLQLEASPVASAFMTASAGQLGGELALCQRYYYQWESSQNSYAPLALGFAETTTLIKILRQNPVQMRITPTITVTGPFQDFGGNGVTVTASGLLPTQITLDATAASAVFTTWQGRGVRADNSLNAKIQVTSEL
jgi:hypothetical protein